MNIRLSLFCAFLVVSIALPAQWNRIIAYGDTGATEKCFDGCIDASGNQVVIYTDDFNDNMSIASFSPLHARNWCYNSNRTITGETHVQQLLDGNYLIAYNEMYTGGLMKLDPAGNLIWQKSYSGFVFETVLEDGNTDLFVCGTYYAWGFAACLDDTGGVNWIAKNSQSWLYLDMIFTLDGQLALTGTRLGPNSETGFVFTKISKQGNEIWTKNYSYAEGISVRALVQSPIDYCFYLTGSIIPASSPITGSRLLYMKCDSSGQFIAARTLAYNYGNSGHDIVRTEGNNYIIAGSSRPQEVCGGTNLVFTKIDSNLDTIMTRRYGDVQGLNMTVYQFKKYAPNENYSFMHAYTWSVFSYSDVILVRTDTMLALPCDNLYFPMTKSELTFTPFTGSAFAFDSVVFGTGLVLNPGSLYAADACNGSVLSIPETNNTDLRFYPNPANNIITLDNVSAYASYEIFSSLGKTVLNGKLERNTIEVASLAAGIYFLQVKDEGRETIVRFVVQR